MVDEQVADLNAEACRQESREFHLGAAGCRQFALLARQRTAVGRCACSDRAAEQREGRRIDPQALAGNGLWLVGDGWIAIRDKNGVRVQSNASLKVNMPQSVWWMSMISRVPSRRCEMVRDRIASSVTTPPAFRMTWASPSRRPSRAG